MRKPVADLRKLLPRRRALLLGGIGAGLFGARPFHGWAQLATRPPDRSVPTPGHAANGTARYPNRALRIVVPQAPGGTTDLLVRAIGGELEPMLGVPVVADNKPGANGIIGTDFARRAAPDGYTLLAASSATQTMAPLVLADVPFDPERDFAPIVNLAFQTKVLAISAAIPAATLAEFIAYAKARPAELNYASTGVGSSSHLDAELLASTTGLTLVHIPYRGSTQTIAALAANEVQLLLASVTAALGAIEAGRVRALAILAPTRSHLLPSVPTIAEAGVPLIDVQTWIGLVGPAGLPSAIVDTLNRAIGTILAGGRTRAWLREQGLEPIGGSPAAFAAMIAGDLSKWGAVTKRLGLQSGAGTRTGVARP